MAKVVIRVRSPEGMFRVETSETSSLKDFKQKVFEVTKVPVQEQHLSRDPKSHVDEFGASRASFPVKSLGLKHGDMLYLSYAKGIIPEAPPKEVEVNELGMPKRLRDMYKGVTLEQYLELVKKHSIFVEKQEKAICRHVAVDSNAANAFQSYLRETAFQQMRMGYLYGTAYDISAEEKAKEKAEKKEKGASGGGSSSSAMETEPDPSEITAAYVEVDAIYEPPQEGGPDGVMEHVDTANEHKVDTLAELLGLSKVGWIFAHQKRELFLTSAEIMKAAELQSKYGKFFVTITVSLNEKGETEFHAFQATDVCVTMYEKGILLPNQDDPKLLKTKTPVQIKNIKVAKPETTEIDVNLLVTVVAIKDRQSFLLSTFPRPNRPLHATPSMVEVKNHMKKYAAKPFLQRVADFHLLLYLAEWFDLRSDMSALCAAIRTEDKEVGENFDQLIQMYTEGV